ncbi:hypothetical protein PMAYCL1PPCAC_25196 [Pristionchus mayeri]|uniref:BTB domain-containing protein n=1 Tax=Pristionchus mayeri TaxID=1317129 RepID=A0AAN5D270_9BILA|nr:hypothetical protein PMAYCL1PPCAC_25196 [Pristionchus mayeri]
MRNGFSFRMHKLALRVTQQVDFTDPDEPCHDVALIIEGEKIYASKQILGSYSTVFKAMFYGDFAEKNKNEIELKDVKKEEFVDLLRVISPSSRRIAFPLISPLLILGDRFDIKYVMDRAESCLITSNRLSDITKLAFSDRYKLSSVKEHCFSKLQTVGDVKSIEESPYFGQLSDEMKAAIREHKARIEG